MTLRNSPALQQRVLAVTGLFLFWLTLNISLNLGVNFAMKAPPTGLGFDFPLAFTMTHMFFSMMGCSLVMALVPSMRKLDPVNQLPKNGLRLVCLSFFYVISISANNMSLINLGLSINQIIKSCAPLPVLVIAYLLQGKQERRPKIIAVGLLVTGAVMAVPYGHPTSSARSIALAVLSTVSVGIKAVLSSVLLEDASESGLIPVVVAWYDACLSGFLLLIACLFTNDIHVMIEYFSSPELPWEAVPVFVAMGTVAFVYNFVALAFIRATSALAIMVAGNLKHVLLIILPAVLVESSENELYSAYHWVGVALFFIGLIYYTAIDVYSAWSKAAVGSPAAAAAKAAADDTAVTPNESTPLTQGKAAAPTAKPAGGSGVASFLRASSWLRRTNKAPDDSVSPA